MTKERGKVSRDVPESMRAPHDGLQRLEVSIPGLASKEFQTILIYRTPLGLRVSDFGFRV